MPAILPRWWFWTCGRVYSPSGASLERRWSALFVSQLPWQTYPPSRRPRPCYGWALRGWLPRSLCQRPGHRPPSPRWPSGGPDQERQFSPFNSGGSLDEDHVQVAALLAPAQDPERPSRCQDFPYQTSLSLSRGDSGIRSSHKATARHVLIPLPRSRYVGYRSTPCNVPAIR